MKSEDKAQEGMELLLESPRLDTATDQVEGEGGVLSKEALLASHRPSRWLRWVVICAGLLIAAGGMAALWLASSPDPGYVTESIRRGPLKVTVLATGKLAPTNRVDVGTELSGIIRRVLVENNDRVARGQLLAELDPSKLDDAVVRAQAALRVAEANVETATATIGETRATLTRLQEIWRSSSGKAPAKAELETAEAAFARAKAALVSATAEVSQARARLSTDETDRAKAAIRAPIDGVVLSRQAEPGQTVAASFQTPVLFTIAGDLAAMKLEVSIDEADVGQVKSGQAATFAVDAFPDRSFPATIVSVNLGPKTTNSSATQGAAATPAASAAPTSVVTYTAVLNVSNTDGSLRPGMTALATIVINNKADVLLAPNAAFRYKPAATPELPASGGFLGSLFDDAAPEQPLADERPAAKHGEQRILHTMDGNRRLRQVKVKIGPTDGRLTEILEGDLAAGTDVVTGRRASGT
ncbi:efflux RND transporter periplasmic adaptor subunit [Bradyrhizobium paxllaeri]|uniref:efflux RND transporter periplasmic adaptor subunit n=1 Tax=Bradyrhizobium paxllaeri TaxID=190148 RepID=UPI0016520C1A|nr:efflux RND transporter periplasmic adaptor subunit [Bradyrhizobium paxllaeri]